MLAIPNDRLYTTKDVGALFRVDPVTVVRWAKQGKLRPLRTPGGQYRFLRTEVDALLAGPTDAM